MADRETTLCGPQRCCQSTRNLRRHRGTDTWAAHGRSASLRSLTPWPTLNEGGPKGAPFTAVWEEDGRRVVHRELVIEIPDTFEPHDL